MVRLIVFSSMLFTPKIYLLSAKVEALRSVNSNRVFINVYPVSRSRSKCNSLCRPRIKLIICILSCSHSIRSVSVFKHYSLLNFMPLTLFCHVKLAFVCVLYHMHEVKDNRLLHYIYNSTLLCLFYFIVYKLNLIYSGLCVVWQVWLF